jgi:DNA transposition AAA+ family ATPase
MVEPEAFVPTSVARGLIARMRITHQRRRISIFSGPPGIGKTTAIDAFRATHPEGVVVVKVARRPAKEVVVLQHALEAFRDLTPGAKRGVPSSIWELRNYLSKEIGAWVGDPYGAVASADEGPYLTFVFDEAQNLARSAIEVLRYWNDADRCYAPFPIGLVFVGNNEFSLRPDASGESAISSAVADRALHIQSLEYDDVTDADIEMFLVAKGVDDASARGAVLRHLRSSRAPRSLRRVSDILEELFDLAEGDQLTSRTVLGALQAV